ncbi:unnamed protein product [Arabidopsis arenosa]|uniref:S1 motif domain-containing protein n=1 Tax=Arabidopsis arenosa TaxID=38785 RepID=A0A8S1ZSI9_ARAAE|nr:unnamed protein product [Arabidopsis arenosa]
MISTRAIKIDPSAICTYYSEKLVNDYKQKNQDVLDPNSKPSDQTMDFLKTHSYLHASTNYDAAAAQGIQSDQFFFTDVAMKSEHIRRSVLADVILDTFGNLEKVEILDLSHNNLSGEFPQTLSKLRELNVLGLRNNKIRGRIPESPQLDRLNDPNIYANNNKLCGMQIQEPCSTQTNQPEEDKEETMFSCKAAVTGFKGSCLNVSGVSALLFLTLDVVCSSEGSKKSPDEDKRFSSSSLNLIHIMKVHPSKVYSLIGSGGKKVKSIIEESGVEAIDMQEDGNCQNYGNRCSESGMVKAIITGLTMVPAVGDIYRNCEIKSMAPYGAFVEIAPGREGLCHISELSAEWLAKPEDAYKVGDRIDVKLIEVNEKGQLRLSVRALLPESDRDSQKQQPACDSTKDKGSQRKYVNTSSKDRAAAGASKVSSGDELVLKKKDVRRATGGSSDKTMKSNSSTNEESLVNGEATIS